MKPWEWKWFQKFIEWCRKWDWFDKYIYGKSLNLEDFVRNPAEVLRDECPPFCIKDVKAYSIINVRIAYKSALNNPKEPNCFLIPMGERKYVLEGDEWVYVDLRLFNKWYTKFCNAGFFFQFALSFKYYVIPIPYFSMNIRLGEYKYFQFGVGWGPQIVGDKYNAVICGKFRYVNQKTSNENEWNPSDVVGYFEGTI